MFVFAGARDGNLLAARNMERRTTNPKVQFITVPGADHFSILAPTNRLIAQKILGDNGSDCNIAFTTEELSRLFGR